MPIDKQFVSVILDKALADKNDPKTATFPGFTLLENVFRKRVGEYRKRFGYDNISLASGNYASGPTTIGSLVQSSNFQLLDFENTPALISKANGTNDYYIYRNITANSAWNAYAQSRIPKVYTVDYRDVSNNTNFSVNASDCAISGNIVCVVYTRQGQVYASFYDASENTVIRSDLLISQTPGETYDFPRVVVNGSVFQILFARITSGHEFYSRTVNIATGALNAAVVISTDGDNLYDATIFNNLVTVVYKRAAGGFRAIQVDAAGAITASNTIAGSPLNCLTIYATTSLLYVSYFRTDHIACFTLNTSLGTVNGPSDMNTMTGKVADNLFACEINNQTQIAIYYSVQFDDAVNQPREIKKIVCNTNLSSPVDSHVMYSASIVSKGLALNPTTTDAPFYYLSEGVNTGTYFVNEELWASALTGFGSGDPRKSSVLPLMPRSLVYGTKVITPMRKTLSIDFTGVAIYGIGLSIIETAPTHVSKVTVNGVSVFGGGIVRAFDGYQTTEVGWLGTPPQPVKATPGSSGSMAAGIYQYLFTYQWVDVKGNVYQSATSIPLNVTVGATGNVIFSLEEYGVTTRNPYNGYSNVRGRLNIFRTRVNGTVFYKLTQLELLINSGLVISVNDATADSGLSDEPVYTTGNILDDQAPPASSSLGVFKGSVMLRPDEDKTKLWKSKTVAPNTGLSFNNNLIIDFGSIGGNIIAHEEMDEKYIVFKENAIYYIYGDGPDDAGQGSYSLPILLVKNTGCIDARTVVKTDSGIIFKADEGFWILTRNMELQFIGANVETHNDKTVTSAEHLQTISQARFTTSDGTILVYDTLFGEWYTWTGLPSKSSGFWHNAYTILKTDGSVWRESSSSHLDNGVPYNWRAGTFFIQMAQIQGYQRLRSVILGGEYRGEHKLKVSVGYDFKEYYEETFEIEPQSAVIFNDKTYQSTTVVPGGTTDNVWQYELRMARQKCQSMRLLIEDDFTDIDNPGNSFALSSIGFEVGVLGGRNRVAPTQKVMTSGGT